MTAIGIDLTPRDTVDRLVGIPAGSPLDALRRSRPQTRDNIEASFRALFDPSDASGLSPVERRAIGLFVAGLHRADAVEKLFADRLAATPGGGGLVTSVAALADRHVALGPFGTYPHGPLSREDTAGHVLAADGDLRVTFGERLAAAFAHTHLLVFHPRDAGPAALERLARAGFTADEVVTLSQIVSFLAFQIRIVHGLKLIAA